ncbi:endonuclease domain-containing protein [Plantactinospora siamensis]|uniref:Endonuclease domain-containing protein n=1 Tax=Plantactinospora siamensis TaxID=555372 RepID=A0ABV6NWX6_9ACTN
MRPPSVTAEPLEWLLFEQAGVLTWRQAVAGIGASAVRHRLAVGRWKRVCRGILVTEGGPLRPEQHWWLAVLAAGEDALLAGLAAGRAGGLRGCWRYGFVDVLVPHDRRCARLPRPLRPELPPIRVRRTRALPDADRQAGRPTRTAMARSLVDAAQWVRTDDEAQSVLAAGCQQRLTTPAELRAVLDRMPTVRRRRLMLTTLSDIAGGAAALSEIDFVRLCRRHGLPVPDLQERRTDAQGRRRYLDAYWRRWRLHVEVDGAHHMDAAQWAADLRRQNEVWIAGDRVLRFTAFDVRRRPDEVVAQVRAALQAAGWRS